MVRGRGEEQVPGQQPELMTPGQPQLNLRSRCRTARASSSTPHRATATWFMPVPARSTNYGILLRNPASARIPVNLTRRPGDGTAHHRQVHPTRHARSGVSETRPSPWGARSYVDRPGSLQPNASATRRRSPPASASPYRLHHLGSRPCGDRRSADGEIRGDAQAVAEAPASAFTAPWTASSRSRP